MTLQGEGKYLGVPSYFIRTTGCNLRCSWQNEDKSVTVCDTPYSSLRPEAGYDFNIMKVLRNLGETSIEHVVITGGEPTIQKDLPNIIRQIRNEGYQVTIETNGTIFREDIQRCFLSLSPKLKSSYAQEEVGMKKIHSKNNTFMLSCVQWINSDNDYQFKFVANSKFDIAEIETIQKKLHIPNIKLYLMPQGITSEQFKEKQKWLFDECIKHGWNYTPRMHIDIFGNRRGI